MKALGRIVLILLVLVVGVGLFAYFRDTSGPQVSLNPGEGPVSATTPLVLDLSDTGAGLAEVVVTAVRGDKSYPLLAKAYPETPPSRQESLTLKEAGLKIEDGPLEIRVSARDGSIYHLGAGSVTEQSFTLQYDTRAPVISVRSSAHNFTQGGAGLVLYVLSEDVEKSGVEVGDYFFPGYRQDSGVYAALLALPYHMSVKEFAPVLVAVDLAGNERRAGFYHHANPKQFRQRRINISDGFLNTKAPEFETLAPLAETPLEAFLVVNQEVRQKNRQRLAEFGRNTASEPLWRGDFLRQPGAATLSRFADHRSYYYNGDKVDQQYHLGVDLASVAQDEVPAANRGTVVFADYLGIYGLCVIIDHGLGLQTIYAHLSSISASEGQVVERGEIIGRTGATGMAGGDHLHYGVILSGLPVRPEEWWDASWLRNNITSKFEEAAARQ